MALEFKDRVSQHPNRRKMTIVNQTETEMIVDVERAEGDIQDEGTPLNAVNLNTLAPKDSPEFTGIPKKNGVNIATVEDTVKYAEKLVTNEPKVVADVISGSRITATNDVEIVDSQPSVKTAEIQSIKGITQNVDGVITHTHLTKLISTGDNLWDYKYFYDTLKAVNSTNISYEVKDGRNCIKILDPNSYYQQGIELYKGRFAPNVQYKFNFEVYYEPVDLQYPGFVFFLQYTDGTLTEQPAVTVNNWAEVNITSLENKTIDYIRTSYSTRATISYFNVDKMQLQLKSNPNTEYKPYTEDYIDLPDIILRSLADGTADEFDLINKYHIKRIDETTMTALAEPVYTAIIQDNKYSAWNYGIEKTVAGANGHGMALFTIKYPLDVVKQVETNTEILAEQEKQIAANKAVLDGRSSTPTANAIATYDSSGCLRTNDPTANTDAVNLGYLNAQKNIRNNAPDEVPNGLAIGTNATVLGGTNSADNAIAIGYNAKVLKVGVDSIAMGTGATVGQIIGYKNSVSIGTATKALNDSCIAVGKNATSGGTLITHIGTIAIGDDTTASRASSIAIGTMATSGGTAEAAGGTVAIGSAAGALEYGAVAIGQGAMAEGNRCLALGLGAEAVGHLSTALGENSYVTETQTIQLGMANLSSLKCAVALSTTSDERDKADINNIPNDKALDFVKQLNPIQYVRNARTEYELEKNSEKKRQYGLGDYDKVAHSNGDKKGSRKRVGFSAQQLEQLIQQTFGTDNYADIVYDNFYDMAEKPTDAESQKTVAYEKLIPFLVGAIQAQQKQIDELKLKINS